MFNLTLDQAKTVMTLIGDELKREVSTLEFLELENLVVTLTRQCHDRLERGSEHHLRLVHQDNADVV